MRGYAVRRLLLIVPTILILTMVLFSVFRMIPGSVVDMMVQEQEFQSGEYMDIDREKIMEMLGLDQPIHVQYGRWMWGIISRGDLGKSFLTNRTLIEDLRGKIPVTLELSILSLGLGLLLSVPIGIYAAIRQDTLGDYLARSWSILALAVPSFWVATLVMTYPAIWWNWTPSLGYIPLVEDPLGNLGQFLLPAFIMGMFTSGGTMRIARTMMLEVLRQDYIRTAWSKGLRERVVVLRHAMRNTMIPVITIIGGMIPGLFGGSVIMEQIFTLPGMGRYLLQAITQRDYDVVCGYNLIFATFVLVVIVLTDMAYAYFDPRIRYR